MGRGQGKRAMGVVMAGEERGRRAGKGRGHLFLARRVYFYKMICMQLTSCSESCLITTHLSQASTSKE